MSDVTVKHQLLNEELDLLILITTDKDVDNMMEEYDRIAPNQNSKLAWLCLFPRTYVHENGELPWWLRGSDRGRCAEER
ncbi:hypothetical protein FF1_014319 [Malus domestica]